MIVIKHHSAAEYRNWTIDQFNQFYADCAHLARIMAPMHPCIMGVPYRLRHFRGALELTKDPDALCFTGKRIHGWYVAAKRSV